MVWPDTSSIRQESEAGRPSLHGSFGAGKSHFMAVLHLLLEHNASVRSIPELARVCDDNRSVENKKFLLVPYHMIGARNMKSAILGGYVRHDMELHATAPVVSGDVFFDQYGVSRLWN
jgi:hypothetical protein